MGKTPENGCFINSFILPSLPHAILQHKRFLTASSVWGGVCVALDNLLLVMNSILAFVIACHHRLD